MIEDETRIYNCGSYGMPLPVELTLPKGGHTKTETYIIPLIEWDIRSISAYGKEYYDAVRARYKSNI